MFAPIDGTATSIAGETVTSVPLDGALPADEAQTSGGEPDQAEVVGTEQPALPAPSAKSVKLVDRDVEAPEVFQVSDDALWDGRPSLGGVWVASPDATDPERVILRNPSNGKFVIGALFRRERDNPGPALQISSDAAEALGLLAGEPGKISVTALRREEVPVAGPDANAPILDAAEGVNPGAEADAATIAAGATAAVAAAPDPSIPLAPAAKVADQPQTTTEVAPQAASGRLIQIGFFSVEANATRAVSQLAKAGITASITKETTQGKSFWSVTARGDRAALTAIKTAGFADAYFLKS